MHGLVVVSPRQGESSDSNWFGCSARHAHSPTCAPVEGLPPGTQLQLRPKPPATLSWNSPCTSRHFVRSPAHLARNDLNRKTATVETKSHSNLKHDNSFAKSPCVSLQTSAKIDQQGKPQRPFVAGHHEYPLQMPGCQLDFSTCAL